MRKRLLCSALVLFTWGCGDGGTPPVVATAVAVAPGTITLDAVGARQVVRATVADQNGDPMTGAELTWSSSSPAVTVAGAGGDSAIVTAVANGGATITAVSGSASGTAGAQVAQVATSVQKANGDAQTGTVAAALAQPLRVRALDRLGAPAVGVTLSFTVLEGAGTLSSTSAVTGADGTATVAWTLGTASGSQHRVRASAPGVTQTVEFTATANPGLAVAAVIMAGNGQVAAPGADVAVPPSVSVRDVHGNPVEGVAVQFSVTGGGGSVTGATVSSGLGGFATVGSWRLGATLGTNTLTVTFPGTAIPAVVFTATASAGAGGTVSVATGQNQGAMAGTAVPTAPSVVVRNSAGSPLAGLSVTFAVTAGGGTVANTTVTTNANGVASAGTWTLGPTAGPNTLRASVAGIAATVEFRGIGCQGGGAGYQLTLCFTTPMTPSQRTVFQNAAARWATVITGDVPDITMSLQADRCGAGSPALDMTFDDLVIFAAVQPIDGPGQVLGSAGPCLIRNPGNLPIAGLMRFDEADVAALEASGGLNAVILHEMGHVLGIGTMWKTFGLLQNESGSTPRDTWYSGVNGIAGFDAVGGATYTGGQKVPVENTGGAGTANGHWRETVLGRELMTGYLNSNGANPLSLLTVRSLTDMGYTVNTAAADAFSVTLTVRAEGSAAPTLLRLHNDIYTGPRYRVDRQGRMTRDGN